VPPSEKSWQKPLDRGGAGCPEVPPPGDPGWPGGVAGFPRKRARAPFLAGRTRDLGLLRSPGPPCSPRCDAPHPAKTFLRFSLFFSQKNPPRVFWSPRAAPLGRARFVLFLGTGSAGEKHPRHGQAQSFFPGRFPLFPWSDPGLQPPPPAPKRAPSPSAPGTIPGGTPPFQPGGPPDRSLAWGPAGGPAPGHPPPPGPAPGPTSAPDARPAPPIPRDFFPAPAFPSPCGPTRGAGTRKISAPQPAPSCPRGP